MSTYNSYGASARTILDEIASLNTTSLYGPVDLEPFRWEPENIEHTLVLLSEQSNSTGSAPTASNDETEGYDYGSKWTDTSTTPDDLYVCLDPAETSAVWATYDPVFSYDTVGTVTTFTYNFLAADNPNVGRPANQAALDAITYTATVDYDSSTGDFDITQTDTGVSVSQFGGVSISGLNVAVTADLATMKSIAGMICAVYAQRAKSLLRDSDGVGFTISIGDNA